MSAANKTALNACSILAHRALAKARPDNPDGWLVTTERNLKAKHLDTALALIDANPDIDPEALADQLDEAQPPPPPRNYSAPPFLKDRHACSMCGCYGGGGWLGKERTANGTTPRLRPCPTCAAVRSDGARQHVPDPADADWDARYEATDWTKEDA